MIEDGSKYFHEDVQYSDALKARLAQGVEMDSAKAMGQYLQDWCGGDLDIVDFGGGPGHYLPVIRSRYAKGRLSYKSVDIDATHVEFGKRHFAGQPDVEFCVGSVMTPEPHLARANCVVSANTLPHVPALAPLLACLRESKNIRYIVFRMLIGNECVQIKKHLRADHFEHLFDRDFQFNNIYSADYLAHGLGPDWALEIRPDIFDASRLEQHRLPEQETNPFYGNRVSRPVNGMIFKGDIYMPWKFVLGRRIA
ncbi:class I SAM-dependent methyltransferase [Rhizobacter sp. J219]|uniref:class I SAM-dependent methyltransferase n=1 Tax=Rhizobacter sp. J219 TaxID=2898430 RepID=UPI0021516CD8|nr:class I SAM-dependent methyltransferase [Rhizobacter sp. J219]MCR5885710.1 class I SAM-dependent methyltransferase [Rhizobacter sp. J219]